MRVYTIVYCSNVYYASTFFTDFMESHGGWLKTDQEDGLRADGEGYHKTRNLNFRLGLYHRHQRLDLCFDGIVPLDANRRTRQRSEPLVMHASAPHRLVSSVI